MVGLDRLELSTSRLSGVRSNHLSYRPIVYVDASAPSRQRLLNFFSFLGNYYFRSNQALSKNNFDSLQVINEWEDILYKGGDPAAGSPTATLLRLHPNHRPYRRRLPPCG